MSKHNKANKNNYNQAGRLTPDEMGREQKKMQETLTSRERIKGKAVDARPGGRASSRSRSGREGSA